MEEMTIPTIISFVTMVITYIFGMIAKKCGWMESKYIPYQNALIGILAGIISWCIGLTENLGTAIVMCTIAAFGAGGGYDLVKNSGERSDVK